MLRSLLLTLTLFGLGAAGLAPLALGPHPAAQAQSTPSLRLTASDPAGAAAFGTGVALSGDTAAIGAPGVGAVYIFDFDGSSWTETGRLTAADGSAGNKFGVAVALKGDRLLVGASGDDEAGGNAGAAYIFERSGASWAQVAKLLPSGAGDHSFGHTVSLDGERAAVGAPFSDSGTTNSGSAYIFEASGNTWNEAARFETGGGGAVLSDLFGWAVALSGDRLAVGAHLNDTVYLFERGAAGWAPAGEVDDGSPALNQRFGWSVALRGDTLVVGAPENDDAGNNAGAAFVFAATAGGWTPQASLLPSGQVTGARFGWAVALDGSRLAVGARESVGANDQEQAGSVYLYQFAGASWGANGVLTAPDAASFDHFGHAVALSGSGVLVGAPDADPGAQGAGAAYSFGGAGTPPTAVPPTATPTEAAPTATPTEAAPTATPTEAAPTATPTGAAPTPETPTPTVGSPTPGPGAGSCDNLASEERTTEEVVPGTSLSFDSALRCRNATASGLYTFTVSLENASDSNATVVLEQLVLTHTTPRPRGVGPEATGSTADLPLTLAPGASDDVTVTGSYSLVTTGARRHANLHFCLSGRVAGSNEPFSLGVNAFFGQGGGDNDDEDGAGAARGDPPQISDLRVELFRDHATLRWRTDQPASSAVAYRLRGTEEEQVARGQSCAVGLTHRVEVGDLQPEGVYDYRVIARSALGSTTSTEMATFQLTSELLPRLFLTQLKG